MKVSLSRYCDNTWPYIHSVREPHVEATLGLTAYADLLQPSDNGKKGYPSVLYENCSLLVQLSKKMWP